VGSHGFGLAPARRYPRRSAHGATSPLARVSAKDGNPAVCGPLGLRLASRLTANWMETRVTKVARVGVPRGACDHAKFYGIDVLAYPNRPPHAAIDEQYRK
jgi:hypothetical protein